LERRGNRASIVSKNRTAAINTSGSRLRLLTMRSRPQLVATDGNGFRFILRFTRPSDLRLVASACDHGAPLRLPQSLPAQTTPASWVRRVVLAALRAQRVSIGEEDFGEASRLFEGGEVSGVGELDRLRASSRNPRAETRSDL
jgi:hypothetical protein